MSVVQRVIEQPTAVKAAPWGFCSHAKRKGKRAIVLSVVVVLLKYVSFHCQLDLLGIY